MVRLTEDVFSILKSLHLQREHHARLCYGNELVREVVRCHADTEGRGTNIPRRQS